MRPPPGPLRGPTSDSGVLVAGKPLETSLIIGFKTIFFTAMA